LIALVFQITTTPPNFFFETYASWLEEAQASARIQSLRVTLHPNGWVNHHGKLSVHCLNPNRPGEEGGAVVRPSCYPHSHSHSSTSLLGPAR
jgi:hypothetical protein